MDCSEAQSLLSAYLDHELDLIRSLEVEKHLKDCVVCSENYKAHQSVSKVIADAQFYHKAPVSLQERVHASLRPQTTKKEQKSFMKFLTLLICTYMNDIL